MVARDGESEEMTEDGSCSNDSLSTGTGMIDPAPLRRMIGLNLRAEIRLEIDGAFPEVMKEAGEFTPGASIKFSGELAGELRSLEEVLFQGMPLFNGPIFSPMC